MLTTALNALLLALLTLVPTAPESSAANEPENGDRKTDAAIVALGDDDVELDDGDGPLVVRVGSRGFVGLHLQDIAPSLRAHFGAPRESGVLVEEVVPDSPASRAGVQVGDVITSVDGGRIRYSGDVSRAIRSKKAGDNVELELIRDRAARKVTVTIEDRKGRERTIDLGDLGDDIRRHAWAWRDGEKGRPFVMRDLEDLSTLRERLEDLEKRMKELEKRFQGR
jgi:membrane-associated protease RseP (regulator of RpoE activity)